MCGIAGVVDWDGKVNAGALLQRMSGTITHRGPDDHGFAGFNTGEGDGVDRGPSWTIRQLDCPGVSYIGLAHRRLSIIDLSQAAHQPMASDDGKVWISYNGEIYNFAEIGKQLRDLGVNLSTTSDTEVVLKAYEQWGVDFVNRCRGMFALAIFDSRTRKLHLIRDRFGIKPLYYTKTGGRLLFASEIKALLEDPSVSRKLDMPAAYAYFAHQIINHRSQTFFRSVQEVRPATRIEVDLQNGSMVTHEYYDLGQAVAQRQAERAGNGHDDSDRVREDFTDAIRGHLISDVPVGSCLSGGLDSSSIVCTVSDLHEKGGVVRSGAKDGITTFSSCHEDPRYDEQEFIDLVCSMTDAECIKIFTRGDRLAEELDLLVWHQDEPFSSPSIYSQYRLMKAASDRHIPVLLDGQGGDELFMGYRKFFFYYLKDLARSGSIGRAFRELAGGLMRGDADLFEWGAGKRYLMGRWSNLAGGVRTVLRPELLRHSEGFWNEMQAPGGILGRQLMDVQKTSLPALLRYEDRNSMAYSIEARVPFLDHTFVETALSMPTGKKISGGISKHVFRQAMRGRVPDEIIDRRTKMGFVSPEEAWIKGPLHSVLSETLNAPSEALANLIDIPMVAKEYENMLSNRRSRLRSRDLFRVLCFDRWVRTFSVTA